MVSETCGRSAAGSSVVLSDKGFMSNGAARMSCWGGGDPLQESMT